MAMNIRNGSGSNAPQMMEDMAGVYRYGVLIRLDWGVTVWKQEIATGTIVASQNMALIAAATTSPVLTPVAVTDDHWSLAIAVDEQERVHIAGNSHNTAQVYLRSGAAGDITTWTRPAYAFSGTGANLHTYNYFDRRADGTLLWFFDQNEEATGRGRDVLAYYLPPGTGTTWLPVIPGSGEFAATGRTALVGEADRAYFNGVYVAPNNRIHLWGIWHTENGDANSRQRPWYLYSDGVGAINQWRRADGSIQPMPITWYNSTDGNGTANITSAPGRSHSNGIGIGVDSDGYPHVILRNGNLLGQGTISDGAGLMTTYVRCYRTAAGWQVSNVAGIGVAQGPPICSTANGELFTITAGPVGSTFKTRIRSNAGQVSGAASWKMGGDVDYYGTSTSPPHVPASGTWEPNPDLSALRRGVLVLQIPDGDTPATFSFGDHHPAVAL